VFSPGIGTGGIFQLRQGQQRRIKAVVKPVQKSGMLPIICQSVVSISVGCPVVRSELQKALDSYQEDDLNRLRQRWSDALAKRREVSLILFLILANKTLEIYGVPITLDFLGKKKNYYFGEIFKRS
jgi:hypothetical protein